MLDDATDNTLFPASDTHADKKPNLTRTTFLRMNCRQIDSFFGKYLCYFREKTEPVMLYVKRNHVFARQICGHADDIIKKIKRVAEIFFSKILLAGYKFINKTDRVMRVPDAPQMFAMQRKRAAS